MNLRSKIYVAGHRGLVGSALLRRLKAEGYTNLLTASRTEVDLTDARAVREWFDANRPEYVFLAAARVGGIGANSAFPTEYIRDNLLIELSVLEAAFQTRVTKLLFLGSSCIYPKYAPQPIVEEALLTGALEPTNQPYAIAKIAGIELCQSYNRQHGTRYICAMPTNLYGPGDNFHPENSHVLPALIRRFVDARDVAQDRVSVWGSGQPRREFLFVDDLASACLLLMREYESSGIINVGCGDDISIRDLAELVAEVVGYRGEIDFDTSKPDGTPRKLLEISKITRLGWRATTPLREGIERTQKWYEERLAHVH